MKISELFPQARWLCWRVVDDTKRPVSPMGGPGSSTDPRTWSTYDIALDYATRADCDGIGIVLHENDDLIGIDLDDCVDSEGNISPWALGVISSMGSYCEWSPSHQGVHILVRCPGSPSSGFSRKVDGHKVEVYPTGRFLTFTGSYIGDTDIAETTVDRISEMFGPWGVSKSIITGSSDADLSAARAYMSMVKPAVSGDGGHNTTYRAAHKLVIDFGLSERDALIVLDEWNQTCQPPWSTKELAHKIRSAAKLGDYSRYRSAVNNFQSEASDDDLEFAASVAARLDRSPIPQNLLRLPGTMGTFAEWVVSQNHRKNNVIGMVAAIALQSLITSRKIVDASGTRTNLYLVGLAPSSGGKQAALDCIRGVVDRSSNCDRLAGKPTSDAGIATQLRKSPASLFLLDEFGLFLQGTNRPGPSKSIQEGLLDLWGAGRTMWRGKSYSDASTEVSIVQPCLSFLGMSTPGHFWAGLTRHHMRDGFAGRMLVIDTGPRSDRGPVIESEPPEAVMQAVAYIDRMSLGGNLADHGYGPPRPLVVPSTCAADEMFDGFLDYCDGKTEDEDEASVWGRAGEKARKLALIYASAGGMVIDLHAAEWAIGLVEWATSSFLERASGSVTGGSGDRQSELVREVRSLLQGKGSRTLAEITKATGASPRVLQEAISTLEAAGQVEFRRHGAGGRVFLKG